MALANGDYIELETKLIATINADTGAGGLVETGAAAVKMVKADTGDSPENIAKQSLPAIICGVGPKREERESNDKTITKIFSVGFIACDRGGDRAQVEASVRKIATRIEDLIREQTLTAKQWTDAPAMIGNSEGVLTSVVIQTSFATVPTEKIKGEFIAWAAVDAEIWIPCTYTYE